MNRNWGNQKANLLQNTIMYKNVIINYALIIKKKKIFLLFIYLNKFQSIVKALGFVMIYFG